MTDEVKLLLKLILAEEEENEAGQKKPCHKKTNREELSAPTEKAEKGRALMPDEKDHLRADMERARREMYAPHEANNVEPKEVPLWAKYALTLPEASQYFHLGYTKLREIVRKDKYAEYLLWNGGRVYIKRKLFEEFLDKETEI